MVRENVQCDDRAEGCGAWRRAAASIVNRSVIVVGEIGGGIGRVIELRLRVNERNSATSARHTGQRSKCSSIATRAGRDTQSSRYDESDCLVSSHDIKDISIAICFGWLTDPGCSLC